MTSKIFGLKKWKYGVAINWDGKDYRKNMFGVLVMESQSSVLYLLILKYLFDIQVEMLSKQLYLWAWSYKFSQFEWYLKTWDWIRSPTEKEQIKKMST